MSKECRGCMVCNPEKKKTDVKRVAYHATPTGIDINYICSNKNNSAITLIALVITITLNMVLGENGIIAKAKQAAQDYKDAESDELAKLNNLNDMIINNGREETNYDSQYESLLARVVALENGGGSQTSTFINPESVLVSEQEVSDGDTYTATKDCAVYANINSNSGSTGVWITIDDVEVNHIYLSGKYQLSTGLLYLKKGQTIKFDKDGTWPNDKVCYSVYELL